jgi:hypothetical protein
LCYYKPVNSVQTNPEYTSCWIPWLHWGLMFLILIPLRYCKLRGRLHVALSTPLLNIALFIYLNIFFEKRLPQELISSSRGLTPIYMLYLNNISQETAGLFHHIHLHKHIANKTSGLPIINCCTLEKMYLFWANDNSSSPLRSIRTFVESDLLYQLSPKISNTAESRINLGAAYLGQYRK